MKLLPSVVAVASANFLPLGIHDSNCLFPNSNFAAVFADPFSRFTFSKSAVDSGAHGDFYAEGTTLYRQCPVEGSCRANADKSIDCDFNGDMLTYPCELHPARKMYAFMDYNQNQKREGSPRTIFFRKKNWDDFKPANTNQVLCPGYGKKKMIAAAADAESALCGNKPIVPNSKQEWAEEPLEDRGVPSNPKDCTIWNAEGTSTSCAVGCKPRGIKPKDLNLVCTQKKYGKGDFKWWSFENGKFRPAGKRLLKPSYWCVPDPDYEAESSGEGSGEGSGAQEIENADVEM